MLKADETVSKNTGGMPFDDTMPNKQFYKLKFYNNDNHKIQHQAF